MRNVPIQAAGNKNFSKETFYEKTLFKASVYLNKKPSLDWQYINGELEKLGIAEYEATARSLALKIFDGDCKTPQGIKPILKPEEYDLLSFSLGANTYGTKEIRIGQDWKKYTEEKQTPLVSKIKYFWKRLTWEAGLYYDFPKLAKYKVLRPVLYVVRVIKVLLCRRKNLNTEIKAVHDLSNGDGTK